MSEHVKREYRSGLRTAQAEQTRRSIVSAAARLFVDDGYGATTIDAVAESAGVSRKTVFTAVGGKVDLLKTALDWAVAGDDQPVAVADRTEVRELLAMKDPVVLLTSWVRVMVAIDVRVAGLFRVLEVAADGDVTAHLLLDEYRRQRLVGARAMVKRLGGLQVLTEGMSRVEAADVAWLATDPVLYDRLVRIRGWSVGTFEAWLARTLTDQLLARQGRRRSE
jgi:AcrR family transcriptional regulator